MVFDTPASIFFQELGVLAGCLLDWAIPPCRADSSSVWRRKSYIQ
jgi:hypothetical protein